MKKLILRSGKEKSLLRRHPWIFSGAVARIEGNPAPGEDVVVCDAKGNFLAHAGYSPASQITGRVWSFDEQERIDTAFFEKRMAEAHALRRKLGLLLPDGGDREIFSEADRLPGVIVDRFGEFLVMQILSAPAEFHRSEIIAALQKEFSPRGIYERSDAGVRRKEKLPQREGDVAGESIPDEILVKEDDLQFAVDVRHGQKTGFYFDLREARRAVRRFAADATVLNAFAYTGGFTVALLKSGAAGVLNIDSSAPALAQIKRNMELNKLDCSRSAEVRGDVFEELRRLVQEKAHFDMVILDPPKLINSQSVLMQGCRAYQDLARLGFQLLNPGGVLFNFSCSGLMTPDLFQKITASAALEANCTARMIGHLEQAPDHPTLLEAPESFYLKGLISVKSADR